MTLWQWCNMLHYTVRARAPLFFKLTYFKIKACQSILCKLSKYIMVCYTAIFKVMWQNKVLLCGSANFIIALCLFSSPLVSIIKFKWQLMPIVSLANFPSRTLVLSVYPQRAMRSNNVLGCTIHHCVSNMYQRKKLNMCAKQHAKWHLCLSFPTIIAVRESLLCTQMI